MTLGQEGGTLASMSFLDNSEDIILVRRYQPPPAAPLLIQDYLRGVGSPETLKAELGINFKIHPEYPELYQFKYDQIESPHGHPLVNEARGLILNRDNDWAIVAHPFHRFFNQGESCAAEVDWNTAICYEKVDGSLCIVYHYKDKWHVATSGTPDASGQVNGFDITFKDLFWDTFDKSISLAAPCLGSQLLYRHYTYMFELCTPYNRVVVPHKENKLWYLGTRDNRTGLEIHPTENNPKWTSIQPVKKFHLKNFDEVGKSFATIDPLFQEGYVVCDRDFNRVKVKHPGYLALHRMRDNVGPKAFLEIIRTGESREFLVYYPEFAEEFGEIESLYNDMVNHIKLIWELFQGCKELVTRKEQAAWIIKNTKYPGVLFALLDGKVGSVVDYMKSRTIDQAMDMLDSFKGKP